MVSVDIVSIGKDKEPLHCNIDDGLILPIPTNPSDLTFKPVFDPHPDNRMLDVNEHYGWMMVFYKTRN